MLLKTRISPVSRPSTNPAAPMIPPLASRSVHKPGLVCKKSRVFSISHAFRPGDVFARVRYTLGGELGQSVDSNHVGLRGSRLAVCVLVPYAPRQRLKRLARRPLTTRGGSDEPPLQTAGFAANAASLLRAQIVCSPKLLDPCAVLPPQSSSSLPEATLSSMASRIAFSSKTGPCPSHLARCFSRLLMSAMSTRPLLYKSWLMM